MKNVNKTLQSVAIAAVLASFTGVAAQAATVVAGNDSSVASHSATWAWDSTQHAELRDALEDTANFGPGGTDETDTIDTVDIATPDAAGLSGVDIFVSSWWTEAQSAAFEADIVDWFLNGGDLLLLQDRSIRDGISTQLGFETINGTANPTTVSGELASGPHGVVAPINQVAEVGHFDNATVLGLGATIYGTDANGDATIIGFEEGAFGPNSGRLVAMSDVDLISGILGATEFDPPNDKGVLALNTFSYLLGSPAAVPLPAGLPLLLAGLGGLGLMRRRRKA